MAGEETEGGGDTPEPAAGGAPVAASGAARDAASGAESDAPKAAEPVAPGKKKRKKTTKGAAPTSASAADADDGQLGATRVIAALPGAGTPDGETLRAAWIAFEVGDYREARVLATRVARSEDRGVAAAAEDVLRRTGVDQVQIAFLVACALAILTIAWIYVPH